MHSWKHSKDTVNDVHAIKLCKTDLGTSPLYFGLSRRVNGGGRWSLILFLKCQNTKSNSSTV